MTAKKKGPAAGIDHTGVCVSFIVLDEDGRVAVHKRGPACRDEQGVWDTGSGQCLFGEDPEKAVLRETTEEYGLTEPLRVTHVGTRNVVRDQKKNKTQTVQTHWICLVYAVQVPQKQPPLVPIPEERSHVLHPMWMFPDNLKLLPCHSQTQTHVALALRAIKLPDHQEELQQERSAMFGRLAEIPGALPLIEQMLTKMAAERAAQHAPASAQVPPEQPADPLE